MADYYALFDQRTNNGRVLDADLSTQRLDTNELTEIEVEQRTEWKDTREFLYDEYFARPPRERGYSPEDILCERVVAPALVVQGQSTRYHGGEDRNPKYPRTLNHWEDLEESVRNFTASREPTMKRRWGDVFMSSFGNAEMALRDESAEKVILETTVLFPLQRAGLLPQMETVPLQPRHGNTDIHIADAERVRVIVEVKSTHSLTLPMAAADVIRRFNNGRIQTVSTNTNTQEERERDKLYVADTVGQLLRYMLLNGCRYGALTSGTRSYFVRTSDGGEDGSLAERVYISDAWFVGEHNYLRAWAYVYSLTANENAFFPRAAEKPEISWAASDGSYIHEESEDQEGNVDDETPTESGEGGITGSSTIQHVRLDSINFGEALGYGRNGCVFRATWEGKDVAVKQFDCGRAGTFERFKNEVKAYEMMKEVQGLYIPKAFFVSELPGFDIKYLGLQLGRDPTPDDKFDVWKILSRLNREYGFKHKDCIRRNHGLVITDALGEDRLVAMDLEEYEIRRPRKNQGRSQKDDLLTFRIT